MLGKKTGGRVRGTPNKKTVAAQAGGEAQIALGTKFPAYKLAKVDSLIPRDTNPRTHSAAQVDTLARLITEYGWTTPILVDGKRGVIAGHGRLLAAKKLGLDVVPTIELSHLSEAQKRAYVIADNQSAIGGSGWNDELLSGELMELREFGFDLTLTAFDSEELGALFADPGEADRSETPGDKVRCPECGYQFPSVNKAFRKLAARRAA